MRTSAEATAIINVRDARRNALFRNVLNVNNVVVGFLAFTDLVRACDDVWVVVQTTMKTADSS
jgi:hypothetical protein